MLLIKKVNKTLLINHSLSSRDKISEGYDPFSANYSNVIKKER